MRKALIAAAVMSAFVAKAEIVEPMFIDNELGVDSTLDYTLLKDMGPWDDRNYQLTKSDIDILPPNDQYLANVPLFFKIQYRKQHPETGRHYPRSLYQNFNGNYGGLLVDGIWYKSELGLGNVTDETYGKIPQRLVDKAASNEIALEAGVSGDESSIECNPVNKNNCVAGTNTQFGQTMYYSTDAGVTWTKSQTNPNSSCCDPTVDWSSDGTRVYQGDLRRSGSSIGVRWSVSTDQGVTWGPMKNITTSGSDKEYMHVDRSQSSPHKDNIYMTWHDGNVMQFARSTDMGDSFSNPLSFSSEPVGIGSDITTDSAGNVYYFYPSTSNGAGVRLLKSTNGGASFSSGTQVKPLNGNFDVKIPAMETRRAFIYTSADVDRNNDTIYVAWTDETDSSAGSNTASQNQTWIRVAKSTNGGSSWTDCAAPHAIDSQDRFHPWIKVGEDSTVHIGYYDTRHSNNRTGVDFYYSTSTNACASWTESRFSTQTSSNLTDGQEWGDYNGLSVVLDKIAMTWTDNRSSKATFVGTATIASNPGGNQSPIASFTSNCNDLTCSFNASASSDSDGSIAGYSWSFGGSGVTASNTFASYGSYSVTLTVTDNEGATGTSTQTVSLADPNASILTNGVAKTGLSGATGNEQDFTMQVPAGATNLSFNMSGGSGDADLYVRFGSAPTTSTYDCRPYAGGNNESCPVSTAQAGTYHVMIRAYSTYSGVSLVGSYDAGVPNVAPNASFTSNCTNLTCSFNGSGSSDSDGTIASYSWSFGGSGATASNTFASAGTYSVTLTVTDNDGATDTATSSVTVTEPPNVAPNASFTSNCNDLTCSFNASASSDSDGSIAGYSWSFGGSGVTASNTFASAGTYNVTLTVTDDDGATDTQTNSVTVTAPPAGNVLQNGVAVTGLSANTGNDILYTMDVPAGATNISFSMSGGSGDADLYVRFGAAPTDSNYDCRPYASGNNENCTGSSSGGTYYVRIKAYSTFSGVSLTGSYTEGGSGPTPIDTTTSNISISRNAWKRYTVDLGSGYTQLKVTISGGSGDADLYVRRGAQSTTSSYDCRPYKNGNNEECTFNSPASGTWHIDLRGYRASSGVTLRVQAD